MKRIALTLAVATMLAGNARAQDAAGEGHAASTHSHAHAPKSTKAPINQEATHETMPQAPSEHAAHQHDAEVPAGDAQLPRTPVPAVTDADRAAAFMPVHPHTMQDDAIHAFTLLDRFEHSGGGDDRAFAWEGQGWIGTDIDRLRWRTQGEHTEGRLEHADAELLYSRMVSPWWDVLGGIRHDFAAGGAQDFAAIGVMGLAPYKFELAATLYLGQRGQSAARFEVEYELPLSARWVLQPRLEANAYGKSDERRERGSGLNDIEAGLRLRWEIRREFAPYIGLERRWRVGDAARFTRAQGSEADDWRWVAGVRFWL